MKSSSIGDTAPQEAIPGNLAQPSMEKAQCCITQLAETGQQVSTGSTNEATLNEDRHPKEDVPGIGIEATSKGHPTID